MAVLAVTGSQWGDEGKGKIAGYLAARADVVARFGGGANAGHTVVLEGREFRLHQVPSGVLFPGCLPLVGNGAVVDPPRLLEELDALRAQGVDVDRLRLSERAHVVMPYHHLLDRLEEQVRGRASIGTTGLGIGPAYTDKAAREGIRLAELVDPDALARRLAEVLPRKNRLLQALYDHEPLQLDALVEQYADYGRRLRPYVGDVAAVLRQSVADDRRILLEGAQGTLLDLDFGTYPFVTSSATTAAGAAWGLGIPPWWVRGSIGVMKAYATRVGHGPFPTEQPNEIGQYLRERGREYGTTTGRPRRCGWLDLVIVRWAVEVGGLTGLAVTLLDVLTGLDEVRIGVAYRVGTQRIERFPARLDVLERSEVEYETLPGWREEVGQCRRYEELPANARRYLERIETLTGVPVHLVSVGRESAQTVERADPFVAAVR
ncbi:adenylosuccinate synthase [Carboxydochorda subterranea]|uniref:Adenylosuccinate synthetase n=1 Tax=Carboxydichorda subterranea TaxID=3109565 RepID=A0ABZ1BV00_9FIRM|nr:adenylosuccinate synthase [Limnochorda sp. L945t]WRP16630.1 adenylosuccinate synthase [Limnochorda sp. L945t]